MTLFAIRPCGGARPRRTPMLTVQCIQCKRVFPGDPKFYGGAGVICPECHDQEEAGLAKPKPLKKPQR